MLGKKKQQTSSIATLVGTGTRISGDLNFRGRLHLDGLIVGDVTGEAGASALTVGADGLVEGMVEVDDLVLNGRVHGDVAAREHVELGPTAQVDGNLVYKVLEMAAGASVNGRLIHRPEAPEASREKDKEASPQASGLGDEDGAHGLG